MRCGLAGQSRDGTETDVDLDRAEFQSDLKSRLGRPRFFRQLLNPLLATGSDPFREISERDDPGDQIETAAFASISSNPGS